MRDAHDIGRPLSEFSPEELQKLGQTGDVQLGWWNLVYEGSTACAFSQYADGFYRATCDLLQAFLQKRVYSDAEALPAFFLVFHFIELALKATIAAKIKLREYAGKSSQPLPSGHDIQSLLSFLSSLFEPGEEFLSRETQVFIIRMARLNGRSAQVFRYPFPNKSETPHFEERPILSIGILREEFTLYGAELNGFQDMLSSRV